MKINKLRFVGGQTVDFPMKGANPSGPFILKGVDGLGPPDVVVNIAQTIQEGGVYQNRRAANRQVVARVGLQPEWDTGQTPEELRAMLYSLMTPKYGKLAQIQAMQDNTVIGQASGHVSKIDPAIFTKDPEVQITLDTTSPYLKAPALVYQAPVRFDSPPYTILTVQNDGDAPTGFWMQLPFTGSYISDLYFNDGQAGGQGIILQGVSFAAGDKLVLDTRDGTRGVWKIPSGSANRVSLLNNLHDSSVWIQLYGGANQFVITTMAFDLPAGSFAHVPTYWGV